MSDAHRLVSLMSRIASERAARGRPAQASRPRLVRRTTGVVVTPAAEGGSPAEFVDFSPEYVPPPSGKRSYDQPVLGVGGASVRMEVDEPTLVSLVRGIDYAELVKEYPGADRSLVDRTVSQPLQPLQGPDTDIIDRLFGSRRAPGVAQRS